MITLRTFGIATALAVAVTAAPSVSVDAATTAVSGTFVLDDTHSTCPAPPVAYSDYDPFIISGDLEGCWYTHIDRAWDLGPPTGLYFETGRELFVGHIRDGDKGTFTTTYTFESQWDPDVATGTEIWGRCQHLIVRGSGTGGLRNVSGLVARTDTATDGSTGTYRGFVRQP